MQEQSATTKTAAVSAAVPRPLPWAAMTLFFAVAIAGLFYVKWSPYYTKAFLAAQNHTLGGSIVSGHQAAPPSFRREGGS